MRVQGNDDVSVVVQFNAHAIAQLFTIDHGAVGGVTDGEHRKKPGAFRSLTLDSEFVRGTDGDCCSVLTQTNSDRRLGLLQRW
jgi:hypothetical protein